MRNNVEQFRDAIRSTGLIPPEVIEADKLHRFPGISKTNGNTAGWCKLFADGLGGVFGDFSADLSETWQAKRDKAFSPAEREAFMRQIAKARTQNEAERRAKQADAAKMAKTLWEAGKPAKDHAYLTRKIIMAHGARLHKKALMIPMRDGDKLHSLQFINEDGDKKFLAGGRVTGCYFSIGTMKTKVLCIAEGFATGATIHQATGYPVAVAFTAGNLEPVARALRAKFPDLALILCADDDAATDGNPGLTKATEAAKAVGGLVAIPTFGPERTDRATDFNDMAMVSGIETVRACVEAVLGGDKKSGVGNLPHPIPDANNVKPQVSESDTSTTTVTDTSPVTGAALLNSVHAFLGRFVAYPSEHAHVAHALWIAHTHLMDSWESTPRIAFLSPEPGSGKTRALEITETLVPRPVEAINATPAYLFRKVSDPDGAPTILYDEIDTLFGPKAKDNEEIRGILNAGHRRGAMAGRCVVRGKIVETEELPAYCAVALAGIGNLPDTILTRCVVIRMRRRAPTENVEPYRRRIHGPEGNVLRDQLEAWALQHPDIGNAWPDMPAGIEDRDADVWEALLAVADAAQGDWPTMARVAAVTLVTEAKRSTPSLGIRLLSDLRLVFGECELMATGDIVSALLALDEGPWADMRGNPIDARRLARYLYPYGVKSKTIRTTNGTAKGYTQEDLHDPWARYLPGLDVTDVTDVTYPMAGTPTPSHSYKDLYSSRGGREVGDGDVGTPALGSVTSVTSVTNCPRCGGEGCEWCTDGGER